jgi:flagellar biosynthesis GTPase FlhF
MNWDDESPDPSAQSYWNKLRYPLLVFGVVVVVFALVLAAMSVNGGSRVSSNSAATPLEPESVSESCTTGPASFNLRVTMYGGPQAAACMKLNQEEAKKDGEFWKTKPSGEGLSGELVCSMSKENFIIEVRDTGQHLLGNQVCARLTARGWEEKEGPGGKLERKEAERESQQNAELEHTQSVESEARQVQEAKERHTEQARRKKEEAAARHKEGIERAKEAAEHAKEDQEHKREEEKQNQEIARENRRNEEETHRAEREAGG